MTNHAVRSRVWILCTTLLTTFLILCFVSCGNKKETSAKETLNNAASQKKEFRMVHIPAELTSPKNRAYFLVSHYWDNFDFGDTAYIHLPEVTEQAFTNYIDILPHTEIETTHIAIKDMLSKAGKEPTGKMYSYFLDLYNRYLYDPNSPFRNDEFYIPVAECIINDTVSSDADRERARFNLDMMKKNRVGQKATDFTYTLASGATGRLYDTKEEYTLLYFYNPDCSACENTILHMKQSALITSLIEKGILKIVALYPDADVTIWKKHLSDIPPTWINGYDKNTVVKNKLLYDLKAIPTIYLLNRDKLVLLKDAEIQVVEQYLNNLFGEANHMP